MTMYSLFETLGNKCPLSKYAVSYNVNFSPPLMYIIIYEQPLMFFRKSKVLADFHFGQNWEVHLNYG